MMVNVAVNQEVVVLGTAVAFKDQTKMTTLRKTKMAKRTKSKSKTRLHQLKARKARTNVVAEAVVSREKTDLREIRMRAIKRVKNKLAKMKTKAKDEEIVKTKEVAEDVDKMKLKEKDNVMDNKIVEVEDAEKENMLILRQMLSRKVRLNMS